MNASSTEQPPSQTRKYRLLALMLAVAAFVAWIGWLAYQVATTANPIVVSRPQILVSPIVVAAEVDEHGRCLVTQVYRGADKDLAAGKTLVVQDLQEAHGWQGPGAYILAIYQTGAGEYHVAGIPPSPGFHPRQEEKPVIYPLTESTIAQLREALL